MDSRKKYKTNQKEILLRYLASVPGVHFTAGNVCKYLKEQGASIGQSTVYRHLEDLVDEGVLNKYSIDGNSPACFEYVGKESHGEAEVCFHCKCESCGKLLHLHCDELQELRKHVFKDHKFQVDTNRTVFYGLCEQCMRLP